MEYSSPINQEYTDSPGDMKITSIIFFSDSYADAMAVLRILGPAEASGINVIRGEDEGIIHFDRITKADIVVIQREFPRHFDVYKKIIAEAHAANIPVVYDLDDLLFELPPDHPDRLSHLFTEALLPMLQAVIEADLVTVASPALSSYILRFNKNVKVIPNFLNDKLWILRPPANNPDTSGFLTIGYMGGHSHKPDLLAILPALLSIEKKYHPMIKFHFWGIDAPPELAPFSSVDWCPPKSSAYIDFAEYFQSQNADLMIAPLQDTEFNRCKSLIKYFEYSTLGIPGIYSKMLPYDAVIEDSVNGMLASTHQEWEQAISRLIEDPDLRLTISKNAQENIREKYLLSHNPNILKQIYESHARILRERRYPRTALAETLGEITQQSYEDTLDKQEQLQMLDQDVSQLQSQIEALNYKIYQQNMQIDEAQEEILSYVLSTSWKVTRPLRKLSKIVKRVAR